MLQEHGNGRNACSGAACARTERKRRRETSADGLKGKKEARCPPVAENLMTEIVLSASRDIPLNKLVLSQANVRRIKAGVSVDELAEDIARRGLLPRGRGDEARGGGGPDERDPTLGRKAREIYSPDLRVDGG